MDLTLPLRVQDNMFLRSRSENEAISNHLLLLINTPVGECITDPEFGFILNNLRFEIFDEQYGTVYNSSKEEDVDDYLYKEKLSGSSKSINTFAMELKNVITKYEKRLQEVKVNMTYSRLERCIYINVKGKKLSNDEEYSFSTVLHTNNN